MLIEDWLGELLHSFAVFYFCCGNDCCWQIQIAKKKGYLKKRFPKYYNNQLRMALSRPFGRL